MNSNGIVFLGVSFIYLYAFPCHPDYPDVLVGMAFPIDMSKIAVAEIVSTVEHYNDPIVWRYINTSATE